MRIAGQTGVDKDGFAVFPDYETGYRALLNQVNVNLRRGMNLNEFFGGKQGVYPGYASQSAGNDPREYAASVADELGIDPSAPLASYQ